MLCQFQQETGHGERFDLSLEEIVVGGVGDHRGLSVLLDTDLLRGQRGGYGLPAGDVLGEGFTGFVRECGDSNFVINGKA